MRHDLLAVCLVATLALTACNRTSANYCIESGTLINTPSGHRPIESLAAGDEVLSRDSRGSTTSRVHTTCSAIAGNLFILTLEDGRTLHATGVHPIGTSTGWVSVSQLTPGTMILTDTGNSRLASIMAESRSARVFDLTVIPAGNFFAGGFLVHNKTVAEPPTMTQAAGTWAGYSNAGNFLRLDLNADGTGTISSGTYLPQSLIWSLDHYTLIARAPDALGARQVNATGTYRTPEVMTMEVERIFQHTRGDKTTYQLIRPEQLNQRLRKPESAVP